MTSPTAAPRTPIDPETTEVQIHPDVMFALGLIDAPAAGNP